jgi:hypothetical protein
MQAHLDTERQLAQLAASSSSSSTSGSDRPFTYTSIREGLYAESTPIYTAFFDPRTTKDQNEIRIPHDGSAPGIAWVKRDELGEATAKLIARYAACTHPAQEFEYVNRTVLLTGPRAWSLSETVEVLSQIAGRRLRIKEVTVDQYAAQEAVLAKFGKRELARTWATAWEAIRAGETAVVTPELGRILGREPEAFDVAVRRHFA